MGRLSVGWMPSGERGAEPTHLGFHLASQPLYAASPRLNAVWCPVYHAPPTPHQPGGTVLPDLSPAPPGDAVTFNINPVHSFTRGRFSCSALNYLCCIVPQVGAQPHAALFPEGRTPGLLLARRCARLELTERRRPGPSPGEVTVQLRQGRLSGTGRGQRRRSDTGRGQGRCSHTRRG